MKVYRMRKRETPQNAMLNAQAVIGEAIEMYRTKRLNKIYKIVMRRKKLIE